ncbi:MAG: hypothetical protein K8W52_05050 [Deltaproteobacteria bacterium]|nr:hypothetical protein [Deltaproteobacteria bacterium]
MRWFATTLAGSIAVHAVLAGLAYEMPRRYPMPELDLGRSEVSVVDVEAVAPPMVITPIELAMVAPPALPALPAPPEPAADDRAAPRAPQISSGTRTDSSGSRTTETTAAATGTGTGTGAPSDGAANPLTMRGTPRRPDLTIGPSEAMVAIANSGERPTPIPESGRLAPAGGGAARIGDLTFTGSVDPDGTVHIKDKPNFNIHLTVPRPKQIGNAITAWAEDPYAQVHAADDPKYGERATRGDHAVIKPDDQKPDHGGTVPIVGGGFDVTDWVARKALGRSGDPYAARKRAALDATRDERVEMGRRYKRDQLAHVDALMADTLDKVWTASADRAWTREALFELWDEGAETGDAAVIEAATRARAAVIGFIRAHLPAGSADAYTAAELTAFNARRASKATFAPY